ncbi:MAG: fatty acid cis/trans isomerase, partial [Gammaproteobacteria bacterium]
PPEDSLTVVNGVLGAYPNAFLEVTLDDIPRLVADITDIEDEARYVQLLDRYGVRRTSPRFWPLSDEVHAKHARARPLAAGILDYNRLENR